MLSKILKLFIAGCILLAPYQIANSKEILQKPVATCQAMAPYGIPQTSKQLVNICRTGYLIGYDQTAKIPNWVSYDLTESKVLGCQARSASFFTDETIGAPYRSVPGDYAKTGYDIGHMANASDMAWSQDTETESFLMTNMTPQKPSVNRGIWKSIETAVRTWAISRDHTLIIVSGSVYTAKSKTIKDGVVVPDAIYKIVFDTQTRTYLAFLVSQTKIPNSLQAAQVSIADIEKAANVRIGVLTGMDKTKKEVIWDIELSAYQKLKKQTCSAN